MPADYLEVDQLTKTFPTAVGLFPWVRNIGRIERRVALDDVSFGVRGGELFGVVGANGAGKSTILRIVAGLVVPDRGTVRVDGIDARTAPLAVRRKVVLCCTDDRSFYYRLTARRNLEYFGTMAGLDGARLRGRIAEVVRLVDLTDDLDRRFDAFSSGMKQRLGIARGLLGDPELLILDEPTRAVDPVHAASIRGFVRNELVGRRGKTVVLATNLLEEAWELCDRIAVLRRGRVAAIGSPAAHDALLARTRAVPGVIDLAIDADGACAHLRVVLDSEPRTLTELLRAVSANGICVRSIRPEERRPADVFADLIAERPQ